MANCRGCGPGLGSRPVAVATLPANPFGLTEILGNLYEWVADCSTADYTAVPADGSAAGGDCSLHMVRGGSWQVGPSLVRVTTRFRLDATFKSDQVGFRVVRGL
jgi:formylglycine-generating enzyme required for sulfatase activity